MPIKIDSTISILTGQMTDAAVKKGVEMIGKWETDLEKAEFTGAKTIHADLVKLRHHLEGGDLDGAVIAELLVKMGKSTENAANHAKGETVGKLVSLGQALGKAGKSLHG